jgi:hypothetical protein
MVDGQKRNQFVDRVLDAAIRDITLWRVGSVSAGSRARKNAKPYGFSHWGSSGLVPSNFRQSRKQVPRLRRTIRKRTILLRSE